MAGLRLLVVGSGMYVTGRGSDGHGTVLPTLAQISKRLPIEAVTLTGTTEAGREPVLQAADQINALLGSSLHVEYRSTAGRHAAEVAAGHDAGLVCVPDDMHFEVAAALLRQGLHCLVVKPLAPTLREARELVELQRERGLHAVVELHKRWDEQNLSLRRLVRQGRLGRLSAFQVEYSQRASIPLERFRAWSARTNVFQYLGVHYVDLVYFLTGYRPLRALAVGTRGVLLERGLDNWDSIHALVEWQHPTLSDHRLLAQYAVGWIDPERSTAMSDQRYVLVGSEGRVLCDQKHRGLELVTTDGASAVNPHFSHLLGSPEGTDFSGYGPRSIATFVEDVADLCAGRVRPEQLAGRRPTLEEGLVSTAVVEAITLSLAGDGSWRDVAPP